MEKINLLVPQKHIVMLSPHYDDVPLVWGGYLDGLVQASCLKNKTIHVVNIFSRSVYQARDDKGNCDLSLKRVQYATGIRLLEDLNCLNDLLGHGNYQYQLLAERECTVRAKPWKPGEKFEFPQGNRATFNDEDWEIFERLKKYCATLLRQPGLAIFTTLSVKEHVDHVIVRDALVDAAKALGKHCRAAIYFGEDQPYTGLATRADWKIAQRLIKRLRLEPLDYAINLKRKVDLVMTHYPSQVEESYRQGVVARSNELAKLQMARSGVERIYRWNP